MVHLVNRIGALDDSNLEKLVHDFHLIVPRYEVEAAANQMPFSEVSHKLPEVRQADSRCARRVDDFQPHIVQHLAAERFVLEEANDTHKVVFEDQRHVAAARVHLEGAHDPQQDVAVHQLRKLGLLAERAQQQGCLVVVFVVLLLLILKEICHVLAHARLLLGGVVQLLVQDAVSLIERSLVLKVKHISLIHNILR